MKAAASVSATVTAPASVDMGSNLGPDDAVPPLAPPGAAPDISQQLRELQAQVSALLALQGSVIQLAAGAMPRVSDTALTEQAMATPMPVTPVDEKRVRIVLEDNDQIPPGGQFAQVDGRPFLLQSGMEMDAPVSLLDVLDHAVTSVPVVDENRNVIGYRDRLRFPYRICRDASRE